MNNDFIYPIIESSISILKETANINVSVGEVQERKSTCYDKNIFVLVGICGKVKGHVIFSMDETLACEIASAIAYEKIDKIFDELSRSALLEIGNVILGNSLNELYKKGFAIDITPPTILIGEKVQITFDKSRTICVDLKTDTGEILEISVSYLEPNNDR